MIIEQVRTRGMKQQRLCKIADASGGIYTGASTCISQQAGIRKAKAYSSCFRRFTGLTQLGLTPILTPIGISFFFFFLNPPADG